MRAFVLALLVVAVCWFAFYAANAQTLEPPKQAVAGKEFSIPTSGSGDGTFLLVGPAGVVKRSIQLGNPVNIAAEDVRVAGRYQAIVHGNGETQTAAFFVAPAKPAAVTFLARPSRVPTGEKGVISGVAFVFDDYNNLVLAPAQVKFDLSIEGKQSGSRSVTTREGIAWTRMDSAARQGAAQFVATLPGDESAAASVRRVVQQVASDACNLRMKVRKTASALEVETDPVKDCTGNPLPDGTIVTFTEVDSSGRSTVDARIKKDVARAELPLSNNATISVASGVVLGNEVHIGGGE
jgi:hypothetical protein